MLPVTLLPIATKTVMQLAYSEAMIEPLAGWLLYAAVPMTVATGLAIWLVAVSCRPAASAWWLTLPLISTTLTFFLLNFAFFRYPFPWQPWTGRTPNAMAYAVAAAVLLATAAVSLRQRPPRLVLDSSAAGRHDW
jgi:hypothetical protein